MFLDNWTEAGNAPESLWTERITWIPIPITESGAKLFTPSL